MIVCPICGSNYVQITTEEDGYTELFCNDCCYVIAGYNNDNGDDNMTVRIFNMLNKVAQYTLLSDSEKSLSENDMKLYNLNQEIEEDLCNIEYEFQLDDEMHELIAYTCWYSNIPNVYHTCNSRL